MNGGVYLLLCELGSYLFDMGCSVIKYVVKIFLCWVINGIYFCYKCV